MYLTIAPNIHCTQNKSTPSKLHMLTTAQLIFNHLQIIGNAYKPVNPFKVFSFQKQYFFLSYSIYSQEYIVNLKISNVQTFSDDQLVSEN